MYTKLKSCHFSIWFVGSKTSNTTVAWDSTGREQANNPET